MLPPAELLRRPGDLYLACCSSIIQVAQADYTWTRSYFAVQFGKFLFALASIDGCSLLILAYRFLCIGAEDRRGNKMFCPCLYVLAQDSCRRPLRFCTSTSTAIHSQLGLVPEAYAPSHTLPTTKRHQCGASRDTGGVVLELSKSYIARRSSGSSI